MSCVYKGSVVDTDLSKNAMGGTEMMRKRLLDNVDKALLEKVAIHFSRPRELYDDVKNILYCHDLVTDPENEILKDRGWKKFDHFVFVSQWQRDQYILVYGIPYSLCSVIPNAIERQYEHKNKDTDTINFIYHTTPHRGLELVYPIFDQLSKEYDNIHLDVFSSFEIYGWKQRDEKYKDLFTKLEKHPNITNHGTVSNDVILDYLDRSHIFMYPSIWQETSCIAMIEAIRSGNIVIHPNYGALIETGGNCTVSYDFSDDLSANANMCYALTKNLLDMQKADNTFLNRYTLSDRFFLPKNSINNFAHLWEMTLLKVGG